MKRILIGITGGIAAYKICEVISTLFKSGIEIRVILTDSAQKFISPLTVSTLSRNPAYTDADFWQPIHNRPLHIELGEWADLFLIAPLTANTLGKLALGLADNLLTNTVLASHCPILLAPAMNTDMWEQISVQRNWQLLLQDQRYHSIGPSAGLLACDRTGSGRMSEAEEIIPYVQSLLHTQGKKDLIGQHILISAGGTREFFDPVRYIGNPSTGKMGIALGLAAIHRGAKVTCVHGVMDTKLVDSLPQIHTISITNAEEMEKQMLSYFPEANITIMAAAVADVKPVDYHQEKLAKNHLPSSLKLTPVPDIITQLSALKQANQKLIGFAAQTGDILTPAQEKLTRKKLDAIAANPIDLADSGFASDNNQAIFIDKHSRLKQLPKCSKLIMAHELLDFILEIP
jgi:phosphopantothenoylcysteine decarboxylase / phosphopantothenate---cysteine ligase